ncbi:UDP-2,3-diacylglucosamine diphosphatase [Paraglaciecola arctica]|uniref:UDP-2,3-diacylglucosamine hydrolase n=1 Tax=Paraglaciecola arctica BSs20135 TaxID=493475 RepID=K6Z4M2_9ALTE|nr:UDP-2,3-diacylglucosamine diphosphatase [Paraglaciecola arctica]GAC18360.1 UDP-2,3-diacylglucosamine hydrolase [Paraglaciecola arctica BSs20135]|tara:strand:- start:174 stop:917 length:744 start_codon:yes stop_codon:yes gene_type:complete
MTLTPQLPFTYFISDLHLSADRDDINQCLYAFLREQAPQADALYVLGDLFEVWIGDDDKNSFTLNIAKAFNVLKQSGVPVYFIHGNRDFLIRQRFAKQAGFEILPEQVVIDLYGEPTLIMHGDELCTKDIDYQAFRKKARSWWWPRIMLSLPLSIRRKLAIKGRATSKQKQSKLRQEIMDVSPEEVTSYMQKFAVKRLIHGHTHRPAIHKLVINDQSAQRIVLGDWYEQGSVLKVSKDSIDLTSMKF